MKKSSINPWYVNKCTTLFIFMVLMSSVIILKRMSAQEREQPVLSKNKTAVQKPYLVVKKWNQEKLKSDRVN